MILIIASCGERDDQTMSDDEDTLKIEALLQEAKNQRLSDPTNIIVYADSALEMAEANNLQLLKGKALYEKAIGFYYISLYADALDVCDEVFSLLHTIEATDSISIFELRGAVMNMRGVIFQRQGQYDLAIESLLEALDNFDKSGNIDLVATSYNNISENFRFIKNYELAIHYNLEAEKIRLEHENPIKLNAIYQNRGNLYFDEGKYDEALEFFELVLERSTELGDAENLVHALNNLGAVYENLSQSNVALTYYLKAIEIYQSRNDFWGQARTLGNISKMYLRFSDHEKAIKYSSDALQMAKSNGFLELEQYNSLNLARIYEDIGENEKALKNYKQVLSLNDSIFSMQKFESINRIEKLYNKERSERIIAEKEEDFAESELNSQRLEGLVFLLVFVFLVVLVISTLMFRQARFRKQKNEELTGKNKIIQEQNTDLEEVLNAYEAQREKTMIASGREFKISDIIYIRYNDRLSTIFLVDSQVMEVKTQLNQLLSELNFKSHFTFSQINQNYIVNFNNVNIDFKVEGDEAFYFTSYLDNDKAEWRTENEVKTRKRSGITKNFEREYLRYTRLQDKLRT